LKDFELLKNECINEVTRLGIKLGQISSWKINTRAKTRWGMSKLNLDGTYTIEIAARLLEDERISETACKETIIHELLHTCKGCMRHTGKWKYYADVVNQVYGYNIKRVTQGQEKGVENYEGTQMAIKYVFTCGKCGATIYRKRDSRFTRNYKYYGCARCGAAAWSKKTVEGKIGN
jgi:predicted SprT family Zn-dependent metalloprotease